MIKPKGIELFYQAAKTLKAEGVVAEFNLYGRLDIDNPGSIEEKELLILNNECVVTWFAHSENWIKILEQSAIVCLPTTYGEGTPKVLLEACASGKPIVATRWPGCSDVVEHGVNGFLFEPDNLLQFVNWIDQLLKNPQLRDKFGRACRVRALNEFSVNKVVDQTYETYKELLG